MGGRHHLTSGSGTNSSSGSHNHSHLHAGLSLLPLLLLLFVIPALAIATLPQWWPACARRLGRRRRQGNAAPALHRRWSSALPHAPPSLGLAAVYPIRWIYRDGDEWLGGLDALRLETRRPPSLVPLPALLSPYHAAAAPEPAPHWMIYCLDPSTDAVVLVEIEAGANLLAEPFLDRGVRRLAGGRAAVVSTATLAAWVETEAYAPAPARGSCGGAEGEGEGEGEGEKGLSTPRPHHHNPMAGGLAWVWNTGRCGSTLLHRVLLAAGVCSLSEPYWLEQLARARSMEALPDDAIRRLLRLCLLADARLVSQAWMPQARATSVNPKGLGHVLLDLARGLEEEADHGEAGSLYIEEGGSVRHLYMYRELLPVVESLASVFHSHASLPVRALLGLWPRWTLALHWPPWSARLRGWLGLGGLPTVDGDGGGSSSTSSTTKAEAAFRAAVGAGAPWSAVGEWGVGRALALSWLDSLATWLEVTDGWAKGGDATTAAAAATAATLRMDDFTHPTRRRERLAVVLAFLLGGEARARPVLEDEAAVARCLAVFGVHSQAGNRMQRSSAVTGRRFLGPKTAARLEALQASVPDRRIACLRMPRALPLPPLPMKEHEAAAGGGTE